MVRDCFVLVQWRYQTKELGMSEGQEPAMKTTQLLYLMMEQSQILEMSWKHDVLISSITNLCDVQTRSIVYIPREKHIVHFCGESGKDANTVDEFIEKVEHSIKARGLRKEERVTTRVQL